MSDSTSLSDAGQPPLRVLLIEDSALIRRSLVEAIDASGVLHVAAYADSSDEAITGINVTPLVDIVLVLLIIFMVTAKLIVSKAVPLDLPKAVSGSADGIVTQGGITAASGGGCSITAICASSC